MKYETIIDETSDNWRAGHESGYDEGYKKGYGIGFDEGSESGRKEAEQEGMDIGNEHLDAISRVLNEMFMEIGRFSSDVFLGNLTKQESEARIELLRKYTRLLEAI
jgi:hypothetical protein